MYVKIHEQIFSSSIMEENVETRYIWFCLLTLADKEGFIDMTVPAIARRINISDITVASAIDKFMKPDPSSRTATADGRRLEKVRESFGWKIINYIYYRDLRNEQSRREYMKEYMKNRRDVNKNVNASVNCKQRLAVLANTDTDTDTDTDTKRERKPKFIPPILDDITKYIKENNYTVDPNIFLKYFTESNWIDSNGKKVKNWKLKIITWNSRNQKLVMVQKNEFGY